MQYNRGADSTSRGLRLAVAVSLALSLAVIAELAVRLASGPLDARELAGRLVLLALAVMASHVLLIVAVRRLERETKGARDRERERVVFDAQRLESIGRLAGGVAHDINNLLSAITTFGSVLKEDVRDGRAETDDVDTILKACASAHDLTRNLLGFARKGDLLREPVAPADLIRRTQSLLVRTLPKNVQLVSRTGEGLPPIEADRNQIGQALLNLAVNAVDAMPEGGTLTLVADHARLDDGREAVELSVADSGLGMTPEVRSRVFEPFFTTKPEGKGTGLGLPMVYGTVRSLGGQVTIQSEVGQGTSVRLILPACRDAIAVSSRPLARPSFQPASGTVLVVDDEPIVRRGACRALKRLGFDPVEAGSGFEAVQALLVNRDAIDVALVDLSMPGLSGEETVEQLLAIKPQLGIVITSGHFRDASTGSLAQRHTFLQKPFDLAQLEVALGAPRPSGVRRGMAAELARSGRRPATRY